MITVFFCNLYGDVKSEPDKSIFIKLANLKPLPKIHYYWPLEDSLLSDATSSKLYHIARTTHSVCFRGEKLTKNLVQNAVYTCARVNKTDPNIPCSIGVNFSPWHSWYPGLFAKDLPPTYRGKSYHDELALFASRLKKIKAWVSEYNLFYGSCVKVSGVILDCERFKVKKSDHIWNEGLRELLDATHKTATEIFPKARIEWYGRGVQWDKPTRNWTGKELYVPSLSCSLYSLPKMVDMERQFCQTCKLAEKLGVKEITPWVSLASGYRYGRFTKLRWDSNWNYDPKYSYEIGRKLNSKKDTLYSKVKVIIFYPEPFNPQATKWVEHYLAYCSGAVEANK